MKRQNQTKKALTANSAYKPLLAAGLRRSALLVTLCYLDNKAHWQPALQQTSATTHTRGR